MNNGFRWRRARAIAIKEIAHISRDGFTLSMALILPLLVVAIFGVAIEFNLNDIPTAYLDFDRTPASRALVDTFGSGKYFLLRPVFSPSEGMGLIESEQARALIIIPPDFQRDLIKGAGAGTQILVDAADNASASATLSYLERLRIRATERILDSKLSQPINIKSRFLFNPELNSKWFIVPGLVVVIMAIMSILLTALTVAREWESGSMELLLSTPVQPLEVIIGKLSPYAGLGLIGMVLVYLVARIGFHVPFAGNHLYFLLGCVLFLVTYLAQGLVISVATRKQMLAMQFALLSGLLPSVLLSGFIFPVESMPAFFRYFTMILPARWFMAISRSCFLQGSTLWEMRAGFFALTLSATALITIAVKRFKKDVEP